MSAVSGEQCVGWFSQLVISWTTEAPYLPGFVFWYAKLLQLYLRFPPPINMWSRINLKCLFMFWIWLMFTLLQSVSMLSLMEPLKNSLLVQSTSFLNVAKKRFVISRKKFWRCLTRQQTERCLLFWHQLNDVRKRVRQHCAVKVTDR